MNSVLSLCLINSPSHFLHLISPSSNYPLCSLPFACLISLLNLPLTYLFPSFHAPASRVRPPTFFHFFIICSFVPSCRPLVSSRSLTHLSAASSVTAHPPSRHSLLLCSLSSASFPLWSNAETPRNHPCESLPVRAECINLRGKSEAVLKHSAGCRTHTHSSTLFGMRTNRCECTRWHFGAWALWQALERGINEVCMQRAGLQGRAERHHLF